MARIYLKENVLEKARERISVFFDDFDTIICAFSGGKDSLVVFHLALVEAEKRNRKIRLLFIDQEAEWAATISEVKRCMSHPSVIPYWIRAPFVLENSAGILNDEAHYLLTYDPENEDKWIHPRDPLAIYEWPDWFWEMVNKRRAGGHGVIMFRGKKYPDFYTALNTSHRIASEGKTAVVLGGIRTSESPGRLLACAYKKYKNMEATTIKHFPGCDIVRADPIYDWRGSDVWKYIYENKLPYNTLYDRLYQLGCPHNKMRVSSVCHEMALGSISVFAEIEPMVWDRVQQRLGGVDSLHNLGKDHSYCPDKFPPMFTGWRDYRDYLFEVLTPEEKKPLLARQLAKMNRYMGTPLETPAIKIQINAILRCDVAGVLVTRGSDRLRFKYW